MPSSFVGCANIATLAHRDAVRRGHPLHQSVEPVSPLMTFKVEPMNKKREKAVFAWRRRLRQFFRFRSLNSTALERILVLVWQYRLGAGDACCSRPHRSAAQSPPCRHLAAQTGFDVRVLSSERLDARRRGRVAPRSSHRAPPESDSRRFLDRLIAIGEAEPGQNSPADLRRDDVAVRQIRRAARKDISGWDTRRSRSLGAFSTEICSCPGRRQGRNRLFTELGPSGPR